MVEIPTFVKGEPGFADKLNQLSAAVLEAVEQIAALADAVEQIKVPQVKTPVPKATGRKAATSA